MPLQVSVDATLLESMAATRRAEIDALVHDLIAGALEVEGLDGVLSVGMHETCFVVGSSNGEARIEKSELAPLFDEYLDVVSRLGTAGEDGFSKLDALDMAKRVTHDRGGRLVKRALRGFGLDHELGRRVFTLLVALDRDTSALTGVHAALRPLHG